MQEKELVKKALAGDELAWEEIYNKYKVNLLPTCLKWTRDYEHAEDIVQQTFLTVFLKLNTFNFESAFSTWVYAIARNIFLMSIRKKKIKFDPTEIQLLAEECISIHDAHLERVPERLDLGDAFDQIAPHFQKIFIFHHVYGYTFDEVKEMTCEDVSRMALKSRAHNAKAKIRHLLTV